MLIFKNICQYKSTRILFALQDRGRSGIVNDGMLLHCSFMYRVVFGFIAYDNKLSKFGRTNDTLMIITFQQHSNNKTPCKTE